MVIYGCEPPVGYGSYNRKLGMKGLRMVIYGCEPPVGYGSYNRKLGMKGLRMVDGDIWV